MVLFYGWIDSSFLRLCSEESKAVRVKAGSIPAPLQCHKADNLTLKDYEIRNIRPAQSS